MAFINVLDKHGPEVTVALHIAVPAGNNAAGVSWANALVNSGTGGTTIMKSGTGTNGTISAADLSAIQAGTLLERLVVMRPGTLPLASVPAYLTATANAEQTRILAELQDLLNFFGFQQG